MHLVLPDAVVALHEAAVTGRTGTRRDAFVSAGRSGGCVRLPCRESGRAKEHRQIDDGREPPVFGVPQWIAPDPPDIRSDSNAMDPTRQFIRKEQGTEATSPDWRFPRQSIAAVLCDLRCRVVEKWSSNSEEKVAHSVDDGERARSFAFKLIRLRDAVRSRE